MKYVKVAFQNQSGADKNVIYQIDEVTVADHWNPKATDPKEMGGFNFSTEDKILRWLVRGDTLYDVLLPEDSEVVEVESESSPHGVFRANKVILTNPRPMTDELAYQFYFRSNLPQKSYYKALAGLMVRGYKNTALQLIKDKVTTDNIEEVLLEVNDFCKPENAKDKAHLDVFQEIYDILLKIEKTKEKNQA